MGTRYQKGEYVEVQEPQKLDQRLKSKVVGKIENVGEKNGSTVYNVVFVTSFPNEGDVRLTNSFKASELRYPDPKTITVKGKEIERGDTITVQHSYGENREVNQGEVSSFGKKDRDRTIGYDKSGSTGRWCKKGQVLAVNGVEIRPKREYDMKTMDRVIREPVKVESLGSAYRMIKENDKYKIEVTPLGRKEGEILDEWGIIGGSVGYSSSIYTDIQEAEKDWLKIINEEVDPLDLYAV